MHLWPDGWSVAEHCKVGRRSTDHRHAEINRIDRGVAVQVHLFGSIDIELGERRLAARSFGGRKPKQLMEILLLRRGHPVPADELALLLWPGDASVGDPATVQHYLSVLRRRLQHAQGGKGSLLRHVHGGYELDQDLFDLDLDRFDAAVAAADCAPTARRRSLVTRALELVTGEVLADEPDAAWALDTRLRYRRAHTRLLLQASAMALAAAEPGVARDLALAAGAHEPYAEPAACMLIAAYAMRGDRTAALAAYEDCRAGLSDNLGVDPMPQTVAMAQAVLTDAPVAHLVTHALRVAQVQSPDCDRIPA